MKNKEIRIIAEFMGYIDNGDENGFLIDPITNYDVHISEMKNSVEWILPVLEKMQKTQECDIVIHLKGMIAISYNYQTKIYSDNLITNMYECAIDFIKWHTTNHKIQPLI